MVLADLVQPQRFKQGNVADVALNFGGLSVLHEYLILLHKHEEKRLRVQDISVKFWFLMPPSC